MSFWASNLKFLGYIFRSGQCDSVLHKSLSMRWMKSQQQRSLCHACVSHSLGQCWNARLDGGRVPFQKAFSNQKVLVWTACLSVVRWTDSGLLFHSVVVVYCAIKNHVPGCIESSHLPPVPTVPGDRPPCWSGETVPPNATNSTEAGGLFTIKIIVTCCIFNRLSNSVLWHKCQTCFMMLDTWLN